MLDDATDAAVRALAFEYMERLTRFREEVYWQDLSRGFRFRGKQVQMVSPRGIFKPGILDLPLTLTTKAGGRYRDSFDDTCISYSYQGGENDRWSRDNSGLRKAMQQQTPLIYLFWLEKGVYLPAWPVYVVEDKPSERIFTLEVSDREYLYGVSEPRAVYQRSRTSEFRLKVMQISFRKEVLNAYRHRCAMCSLAHARLLDAAPILTTQKTDRDFRVNNGLALCKLHHAAFDEDILGINPDYRIEVRPDILRKRDASMLRHGIQEMQGNSVQLPAESAWQPDAEALHTRWEKFCRAC